MEKVLIVVDKIYGLTKIQESFNLTHVFVRFFNRRWEGRTARQKFSSCGSLGSLQPNEIKLTKFAANQTPIIINVSGT